MGTKLSNKEFIDRCRKIHGNKYTYSKVNYLNNHTKVTIICKEHGEFLQTPKLHYKKEGCPSCGASNKMVTKDFINKAKKVHKNKYNYLKSNYTNTKSKVIITCPKHGDFQQKANNHILGKGCKDCGRDRINKSAKNNPTGWSYTNWFKSALKSKTFTSYKVYLIRIEGNGEKFYKIGKTYNTIDKRFDGVFKSIGYRITKCVIIEEKFDRCNEGFAKTICELENIYKKQNKHNKYTPKKKFSGMNECFSNTVL
jgi:Zn finger protein HypA/HybF involved in hydrogenase expression